MAPGVLVDSSAEAPHSLSTKALNNNAPKDIFPDGIRTSGQHPPIYEILKSYDQFPKEIVGQTVWKSEDYQHNPEKWVYVFTSEDQEELKAAIDGFMASGVPLTGITKDLFPLPKLAARLDRLRQDLLDGKGFILFKNFPVQQWVSTASRRGSHYLADAL